MKMFPYQLLDEISIERPAALPFTLLVSLSLVPEIRFDALRSFYTNGANNIVRLNKGLSVLSWENFITYPLGGRKRSNGKLVSIWNYWKCSICGRGPTESRCSKRNHAICKSCESGPSGHTEGQVELLVCAASMDVRTKAGIRQWFKRATEQLQATSDGCFFRDDKKLLSTQRDLFQQSVILRRSNRNAGTNIPGFYRPSVNSNPNQNFLITWGIKRKN